MKRDRKKRKPKIGLALVIVSLLAVTAAVAYWKWPPGPAVDPPNVDLTSAPAEMRELIESSRLAVLDDASSDTWAHLGSALLANGFHIEAAEAYQQAVELDPRNWRWIYLRAIALESDHRPASFDAYKLAESLQQNYAPLCGRLALAYERNGQMDEARENWNRVLQLEGVNYGAYMGLARLALADGDLDAAREHSIAAAAMIPLQREAHILLVQIYLRLDDQENVVRHKQQLAKCRPVKWRMRDAVFAEVEQLKAVHEFVRLAKEADRYLREGNLREFIAVSEKLVELQPDYPNPSVNLGMAIGDLGYEDQALALLTRAAERFPHSSQAHYNLGLMLARSGNFPAAERSLKKALDVKPDFVDVHLLLGNLYQEHSKLDQAEQSYRKAVEVSPDNVGARLSLAETLRELGKLDEAIEQFELILKMRPDDAPVRQTLKELRSVTDSASPVPTQSP